MDPIEAFDVLWRETQRLGKLWRENSRPRCGRKLRALCVALEEMINMSGSRSLEEQLLYARKLEVAHFRVLSRIWLHPQESRPTTTRS